MEKNATKRGMKRSHSVILIILLVAIIGYVLTRCVINLAQAADNKREIAVVSEKVSAAKTENDQLKHFMEPEHIDEYYEKVAREDYDYAKPGERVFFDSSLGNKK